MVPGSRDRQKYLYPILREAIGDETLAGASDTQIVAGTGVGIAAVGAGIYAGYGGMMLEEAGGILFEHHTGLPLVINPIDIVQRGTKQGAKSFVGFANVPIEKNFVDLTDTRARKHILDGDLTGGGHRWGTGKPGKSEFPLSWSDDKILHAISDIATDPKVTMGIPDKKGYVTGVNLIDGVEIRVAYDTKLGRIISGFPINLPRNP